MKAKGEMWVNHSRPAEPIFLRQMIFWLAVIGFIGVVINFGVYVIFMGSIWRAITTSIFIIVMLFLISYIFLGPYSAFISETWPASIPPGHVAPIFRKSDGSFTELYALPGRLVMPAGFYYELLDVRPVTRELKSIEIQTSDSYKLLINLSFAYHIEDPIQYQSTSLNPDAVSANAVSAISSVASECEALRLVALRNSMCAAARQVFDARLGNFGCAVDYFDMNPRELPAQLNAELRAFAVMKKQYPSIDEMVHVDLILARHGALKKEVVAGTQERKLNVPGLSEALTAALRGAA